MGVYRHRRSPYWQLWLETAPPGRQREGTKIVVGTTISQQRDSRRLAEQHYLQRMHELAQKIHRLPVPRDDAAFHAYAIAYARDTIAHHKGADREGELLKPLRAFFGAYALTAIDRDLVKAYMTARRATRIGTGPRKVSPATVNREVDLLKAMLRDAVPKFIEVSPIAGMKRLTGVRTPKRLLQPDEEVRLLKAAADPQDYALLVLGIDTLVRLGDLLDLRRSDRLGLWLTIRDPKQQLPYQVPLSPRAAAALDAIAHEKPYFFEKFRRAEKPRDWRSSVRQRLEWLCAAADPPVPFGPGGITFHGATRKTGATRLLIEKRVPLAVVQKIGNWRTPDVLLEIYTEAQRDDLLAAVGQPKPSAYGTRGRRRKTTISDVS